MAEARAPPEPGASVRVDRATSVGEFIGEVTRVSRHYGGWSMLVRPTEIVDAPKISPALTYSIARDADWEVLDGAE